MTLDALRAEYRTETIGPLIRAEVKRVARDLLRNRPPQIYSEGLTGEEAVEDLAHDIIEKALLHERQIDYLLQFEDDVVRTLEDFRAVLRVHARRVLNRRRRRSGVDGLIRRSREILEAGDYTVRKHTRQTWYAASPDRPLRHPSEAERVRAVTHVWGVRPTISRGDAQAPRVYTRAELEIVLRGVALALPTSFTMRDLDDIFFRLLGNWIRGEPPPPDEPSEPPEIDEETLRTYTSRILQSCSNEDLLIVKRRLAGFIDLDIAHELGIARTTVLSRRHKLEQRLQRELEPLADEQRIRVLEELRKQASA